MTLGPVPPDSTTYDATYVVQFFPAYYIFNAMLVGLLVLHCIWTYYILLMAYQALSAGQVPSQPPGSGRALGGAGGALWESGWSWEDPVRSDDIGSPSPGPLVQSVKVEAEYLKTNFGINFMHIL